jgi:ATP-dependent RNA helicase DDX35
LAKKSIKLDVFSQILFLLENYQVLIVVGDTGCGKSTQIPQFLVEANWCREAGKMVSDSFG